MTKGKIPADKIAKAVKLSKSMQETFRLLDVRGGGTSYKMVRKVIEELNLDISHWETKKPGRQGKTIPLEEILVKDSNYTHTASLKKRLIRAGVLEYYCHTCGIRDWQGKYIGLHLDHINGDDKDNRLNNIRLLCPNCHAQTPTFGVKGKKERNYAELKRAIKAGRKKIKNKYNFCEQCGKGITREAKLCKSCHGKVREKSKIEWPEINELVQRVKEKGYTAVGKELGVSDNAVRKHIQKHS